MSVKRDKIIKFCQDYLKTDRFQDFCFNGLQVEGKKEVKRIVTGVSLNKELIQTALQEKAELIIVHHGFFNDPLFNPPQIKGVVKKRLRLLLENNLNLAGFHLPLDAHPVIGNNISLLKLLGLRRKAIIKVPKYDDIGYIGELGNPLDFSEFVKLVDQKLNTKSYVIPAGSRKVKKVGIISGGASPEFRYALAHGADTYLCGDVRESVYQEVKDVGINFINAGHYNTEKLGIYNLGKLIEKKFGLPVKFVDIPCDV